MGTIVNLRRARKARARSERTAGAAANAARHGVPKAERARTQAEADMARRSLDGHALHHAEDRDAPDRDPPDSDTPDSDSPDSDAPVRDDPAEP